jgi:nucleotide-binding universal stress UspA family protein
MPHRILVATDFSAAALRAVHRAARLARLHGATLRLLHVAPPPSRISLLTRRGATSDATVLRAARVALEAVARDCEKRFGLAVSVSMLRGAAHGAIARAAASDSSDLIVVGALGEHEAALKHTIGGTAQKLIGAAGTDLLIVRREPRRDHALQLLGVDLSGASARLIARALAALPSSQLALACCFDLPHASRALAYGIGLESIEAESQRVAAQLRPQLAALARQRVPVARRAGHVILHGDPRDLLPRQARLLHADCLTLSTAASRARGRQPLLTFGDVAPQIVSRSACDVLLLR